MTLIPILISSPDPPLLQLHQMFGLFVTIPDVLHLESSTDKKFSRHLIFHLRVGYADVGGGSGVRDGVRGGVSRCAVSLEETLIVYSPMVCADVICIPV